VLQAASIPKIQNANGLYSHPAPVALVFRLVLLLAALVSGAAADVSFEQLKALLPGHTVALRVPFKGSEIYFDLDGRPIPPFLKGTQGRDGFVTITDITRAEHNVILTGHRAALLSFGAGEPLQFFEGTETVRVVLAVSSHTPAELGRRIARVIHSVTENKELISAYNNALTQNAKVGERQVTTDCELLTTARPITRALLGKKIEALVIVNELGEPDALAFRTELKKRHEKVAAAVSIWNWRFAPVRSNGKLISCSQALTVDATNISRIPDPSQDVFDLSKVSRPRAQEDR
jgi:hypothetical protein